MWTSYDCESAWMYLPLTSAALFAGYDAFAALYASAAICSVRSGAHIRAKIAWARTVASCAGQALACRAIRDGHLSASPRRSASSVSRSAGG